MDHERDSLEVAIVGGGIVGLVLAAGLARRQVNVKVYEQAQTFREIGAGIAFNATAIGCMELIDPAVVTALRLGGAVPLSAADENDPNDYLRWLDGFNQRNKDDPYQQKFYCKADAGYRGFEGIRRDQFLEELVNIFPTGNIEFKKRLERLEEEGFDDKMVLHFQDGTLATADAVIGCDGIKSLTRQILMGKNTLAGRPSYTHINSYRTLIPMDKAINTLGKYKANIFHNHIGPKANLLHYPVANSTMVNVTVFVHDPNEWPDDRPTTLMGRRQDIQDAFTNWNPAVRELISLFPDQLHMWAVFDLWEYPIPYYNRGRLCLAGDAAHASSPHHGAGASMGIEDALCLSVLMAEVLTTVRHSPHMKQQAVTTAFETYDAIRRTRSQWLVNSSRRMCDLHHQDDWADPTKWLKAETCFEEVKDRSYKIWYFDYTGMVKQSIEKYCKAQKALFRVKIETSRKNGLCVKTLPGPTTNEPKEAEGQERLVDPLMQTASANAGPRGDSNNKIAIPEHGQSSPSFEKNENAATVNPFLDPTRTGDRSEEIPLAFQDQSISEAATGAHCAGCRLSDCGLTTSS